MKYHLHRIAAATAAAAILATTGVVATARPASADTSASAFWGAVAGSVIGSLLFDGSRNQYYYVQGGGRHYVSRDYAAQYYQHRDPHYYNAHRGDFQNNPQAFAHNWNNYHHG
jgi:hypothetical protein